MGPMIRAASLRGFETLVSELGGEPRALLSRFGIDPAALVSDDALVSLTAHDRMLDAAARDLGAADFGLRLALHQDLTILGPLAVAIESSATAAEALDCASRFLFVHSPALRVAVEPDPRGRRGVVALTYRKDLRESPYSAQGSELGLALFHRIAVVLMGGLRGLRAVHVPHAPLSPVQRYVDHFGADVKFGEESAALLVDRRLLDERFRGANPTIRQFAVDHLASRFADPDQQASTQVRLALAESLGSVPPTLERTARLLALHPRTLQRRLSLEGVTFAAVLDDVRRGAAHRYLTGTDLPVGQVALLVGFTEQSTLGHAVRRWYGVTPRELRRTQGHPAEMSS